MKKLLTIILVVSISCLSCKKEAEPAARNTGNICVVCQDFNGTSLLVLCGPTEDAIFQTVQDSATCLNGFCPPTRAQFNSFCHGQ